MRKLHEKVTYSFIIGSSLMHVFCCGIPLLLTLFNVAAMFGMTSASILNNAWFEQFEEAAIIVSAVLLLITGALQYISYRINCRTDGACHHEPCDSKKRISQRIYWLAVLLFIMNLALHIFAH